MMAGQESERTCRSLDSLVSAVRLHHVPLASVESMPLRVMRGPHLRGQVLATATEGQSFLCNGEGYPCRMVMPR